MKKARICQPFGTTGQEALNLVRSAGAELPIRERQSF